MHHNSKLLFEKYGMSYFKPGDKVLEVGPNIPSPYQKCLLDAGVNVKEWFYADIVSEQSNVYHDSLHYIMKDEYNIDAESNSFDVVFSAQVFEHVRKPWIWLRELTRLTKPGGYVITQAPVSWPYHEAPIDCWRAHPEGMKAVLEDAGLQVIQVVSECLETSKPIFPGKGLDHRGPKKKIVTNLLAAFGWPLEAAIDIIAIAKKPI